MATGCEWDMGTVWTGPRRCGRSAKYKVTSGPVLGLYTYLCGIHVRANDRLPGAGSEALKPVPRQAKS